MNLDKSRLGALFIPDQVLWSGVVQAYDDSTFTLTVSNITGSLTNVSAGLAVYKNSKQGPLARIRSLNAGARTITLAENGIDWEVGSPLLIYPARVPWTRYQYIDGSGVIYKDYALAWSSAAASLPPLPLVQHRLTPGSGAYVQTGAVWVAADTGVQFTATNSRALYPSASISSYSWTPGTDGTITAGAGTGALTVEWSSVGFRYLKLTITDSNGETADRYIPVWVGLGAWPVASARMQWNIERGWTANISLQHTLLPLYPSPVALVDLDTYAVVFFGFLRETSSSYQFSTAGHDLSAEGALAYANAMHAYPFGVEDSASPTAWNEVHTLTLARALFHLLHWQSTMPEVVNCDVGDPTARRIKEQPFTSGNIGAQMREVAGAAHQLLRAPLGGGGFVMSDDPLYREASYFDGLSAVDLSDASDVYPQFDIDWNTESVSEVRVSGVYQDVSGSFEPVIAQAPEHPGALGSPKQVTNMAPLTEAEATRWAEREYALDTTAAQYRVKTNVDVEPSTDVVADLPDGRRVALENVSLNLGQGLSWEQQITGRTYGDSPPGKLTPVPTITEPDPVEPDDTPPVAPIIDPDPTWPSTLYAATWLDGVFYTADFDGPQGDDPTWATVNGGLPTTVCRQLVLDPNDKAGHQYVLVQNASVATDYDLYHRAGTWNWTSFLTSADARTEASIGSGEIYWFAIDASDSNRMYALVGDPYATYPYCLYSADGGSSWNAGQLIDKVLLEAGSLVVRGSVLYAGASVNAVISRGYIFYSLDYGATWTRVLDRPLGASAWSPTPYLHPDFATIVNIGAMETGTDTYAKSTGYAYQFLGRSLWAKISNLPQGAAFSLDESYPTFSYFPGNTDYQALIDAGTLRYTEDDWDSASSLTLGSGNSMSDVAVRLLYTPVNQKPDWRIFGKIINGDSLVAAKGHVLYVSEDNGISLTGRAGGDPLGGTDSIPYDCGGLCHEGLGIVG